MHYHHTYFYLTNSAKARNAVTADDQLRNNVDEKPTYFVMVSSDVNLRLILSGLMGKQNAEQSYLLSTSSAPSSSLTLELIQGNDGTLTVEGHFNDEPIQLGGCTSTTGCLASSFLTYLESVTKITDVAAACKGTTPSSKPEILQ